MSYAFVQDVPATWDTYRGVAETLAAGYPEGLVVHAAGPTEEGFRMIGIWDSREMCERFRDERLTTILDSLTCGTRIQPTSRELQIAHLISGEAALSSLRWSGGGAGGSG
jgi:hypothetical protein